MVQIGTNLKNMDNSGATTVKCIGALSSCNQHYVSFGNVVTVSIQKLRSKRRPLLKVKRGQVLQALIIRTKIFFKNASNIAFFENSVVLLNSQKKLIGTRIFGSLPKNLRYTKFLKLTFLARGLVA
jgi:large subunit ribosomal protein L14